MVTASVTNTLVIYASAGQVSTRVALVPKDCEDTLNALGNYYACNKPWHMKRDCPTQTQARKNFSGGQKKEFSCYNCDKWGHMARDCDQPKKNLGMGTAMTAQDEEDMPGDDGTVQQEARGFSVK